MAPGSGDDPEANFGGLSRPRSGTAGSPNPPVDLLEEPQQIAYLIVRTHSVPMELSGPLASALGGPGVELELLEGLIVFQGLPHALRYAGQLDLGQSVAGAPEKPDLLLAEDKEIIPAAPGQERQEGFEMKAFGDNGQFVEPFREAIGPQPASREKGGEPVAPVT
jgi:hypothetical protein